MSDMFRLGASDLINLQKFYKRAPKKFKRAQANVLNSFAFGTRTASLDVIFEKMITRNKRFASSSMRVDTASAGRLQSRTGSITRARFTGWLEQQTGERDKRTRVATTLARGNNTRRQVRPMARMKQGNTFQTPDDFHGKSGEHRVIVMLATIQRKKDRRPFVIKGHRKWKKGLYKLHGKRVRRLQTFGAGGGKVQRIPWITMARSRYFAANPPRDVWAESLRRVIKFK